jgi:hypothetical protein
MSPAPPPTQACRLDPPPPAAPPRPRAPQPAAAPYRSSRLPPAGRFRVENSGALVSPADVPRAHSWSAAQLL